MIGDWKALHPKRPDRPASATGGRVDRPEKLACGEVRIGQRVGGRHHHPVRPRRVEAELEDLPLGVPGVPRLNELPQLLHMLGPGVAAPEPFVTVQPINAVERALQLPVLGPERPRTHVPVGARERPSGKRCGRESPGRRTAFARGQRVGDQKFAPRHQSPEPRHVDMVAPRLPQPGQGGDGGTRAGKVLGLPSGKAEGRGAAVAGLTDDARAGQHEQLVFDRARFVGLEPPGGHGDQKGTAAEAGRVEGGAGDLSAHLVGDDHVGPNGVNAAGGREPLAGVEVHVEGAQRLPGEFGVVDGLVSSRVAALRLDLHHRGPQHGEEPPGVGSGDPVAIFQHVESGEGGEHLAWSSRTLLMRG